MLYLYGFQPKSSLIGQFYFRQFEFSSPVWLLLLLRKTRIAKSATIVVESCIVSVVIRVIRQICKLPDYLLPILVRSLSGKNWQDRDKADKVGISFSRDSQGQLKWFWGCNEEIRKIYHRGGGGETLLF